MSDLTTIPRFIPKLEYDQVDECDYVSMEENLHGDYVRFADYDQLRAEVDRLREDLQSARKAMDQIRSINASRDGGPMINEGRRDMISDILNAELEKK